MAMEAIPSNVTATKGETKACSVFLLTSCLLYSCFEARDFGGRRRRRRRRRRRATTHTETYLQTREQCMRSRQSSCEKMRLLMSQGNCNAMHRCSSSCCCNPSRVLVSAAPPPPLLLSAAIPYQYEKSAAAAVAPISLSLSLSLCVSLARSLSSCRGRCYKDRASFRCNRKCASGIARSGGKNLEDGFPVHGKKKASQQARARAQTHDRRSMSVRQRLPRPQSGRSSKRDDAPPLHCTIRSRCPFDCMRDERTFGGRRENYRKKSLLLLAWRSSRYLSYASLLSSFDCNLSVSHDLGAFVLQAACECGVIQEKNLRFCPDFTRSFSFRRIEEDMAAARRGALHILRRPSGLISLTRGSGMAATVRAVATSSLLSSSSSPPASSSDSGILLFRGFSASNRTPSWHSSRFFAAEAGTYINPISLACKAEGEGEEEYENDDDDLLLLFSRRLSSSSSSLVLKEKEKEIIKKRRACMRRCLSLCVYGC